MAITLEPTRRPTGTLLECLESHLPRSSIVTPTSPYYDESLKRWAKNSEKKAAIVTFPTSAEEVSKIIKLTQEHKIDLAISGGGHNTAGCSSSHGGLVIDLSHMRQVHVDVQARTVTAQGGCKGGDLDAALAPHNLCAVAGTTNHTGVGGVTLGGGYGWLTGEHGLMIDNLLAAKIVLANGDIVTASEAENADLFWAIRGAGQNFGVVVELMFRVHEMDHEVYSGYLFFAPEKLEKVAEFMCCVPEEEGGRAGGGMLFGCAPGSKTPMVGCLVFFNGALGEAEEFFKALVEAGPFYSTVGMRLYYTVNSQMNADLGHGMRTSFHGVVFTTPVRAGFCQMIWKEFVEFFKREPDASQSYIAWEFFSMGKVNAVPGDAMAFANRGDYQNGIVVTRCTDPTKDEEHRVFGRHIQGLFRKEFENCADEHAKEAGARMYGNYIEPCDATPAEVFGPNYSRLQKLKAKYDPNNVFNKLHAITPSLET